MIIYINEKQVMQN